jgi:hypothetical protein
LIGFRLGGFALEDSGLRPQVKSSRERSRCFNGIPFHGKGRLVESGGLQNHSG